MVHPHEKSGGKPPSEYVTDLPQYLLRKPFFYLCYVLLVFVDVCSWLFGFHVELDLEERRRYVWFRDVDLPSYRIEKKE